MSTASIFQAVVAVARRRLHASRDGARSTHLDIGAGRGDLIRRLDAAMALNSQACDFHVELFDSKTITCRKVDLNHESLPYPDAAFDLVTSSEVVEHLENYHGLVREAYRVTAGGGVAIFTTPNVLNVKSRLRYFISGFANLFGPLPVGNRALYGFGAHITPIPYFYLAHALADAGFVDIELDIDKVQKTSVFWLLPLAPVIQIGRAFFMSAERTTYKTLDAGNEPHVRAHFSWPLLVGRTIVVSAMRAAQDQAPPKT